MVVSPLPQAQENTMPQISPRLRSRLTLLLDALLVLCASALAFGQFGFQGPLERDDAIYLYSGQQMARGIPPYVSIFDHKGPLAPMIAGAGAWSARWLGIDDILAVRLAFCAVSLLTVLGTYLLASHLFSSRAAGLLAAFVLISFWGFGRHAASGPRAKAAMLLFEVLALWLTARRAWFWAGLSGALAFLTWQPTAIYPLITVMLAVIQSRGPERIGNPLRVLAGILAPAFMVGAYFGFQGAFRELVDGLLLFNLVHLEREAVSYLGNVRRILVAVSGGYGAMFVPIWLGLAAMPLLLLWRLSQDRYKIPTWLSTDRWAALLLSAPLPLVWSVIDFQWYPDFYVFLPYVAIGLTWFLHLALRTLGETDKTSQTAVLVVVCVVLLVTAVYTYRHTSSQGLVQQRAWAHELLARYGSQARIVSIGVPEALVLLRVTNPHPYGFILNGIDNRIEATTPGGFDGWLADLASLDPDVIVYGAARGKFVPRLEQWLETRYQRAAVGQWILYVRPTA